MNMREQSSRGGNVTQAARRRAERWIMEDMCNTGAVSAETVRIVERNMINAAKGLRRVGLTLWAKNFEDASIFELRRMMERADDRMTQFDLTRDERLQAAREHGALGDAINALEMRNRMIEIRAGRMMQLMDEGLSIANAREQTAAEWNRFYK